MKNTTHHTLSIPSAIGLVLVIAGVSATGGYLFGFESGKDKVKASHITASAVGLTRAQKLIAEDTLARPSPVCEGCESGSRYEGNGLPL